MYITWLLAHLYFLFCSSKSGTLSHRALPSCQNSQTDDRFTAVNSAVCGPCLGSPIGNFPVCERFPVAPSRPPNHPAPTPEEFTGNVPGINQNWPKKC